MRYGSETLPAGQRLNDSLAATGVALLKDFARHILPLAVNAAAFNQPLKAGV